MLNIIPIPLIFKVLFICISFIVSSCSNNLYSKTKNLLVQNNNVDCPNIILLPEASEIIKLNNLKNYSSLKEIYNTWVYIRTFIYLFFLPLFIRGYYFIDLSFLYL